MKKTVCILFILFLSCCTLVSAQADYIQKTIPDTLGLSAQIDSAFSLHGKDFKSSVKLTDKTLQRAQKSKSKSLFSKALYNAAILDWYDGVHPQSLKKTHQYITLSKQIEDTTQIAKGLSQLGLIYLYTADYDSSLYYFDQSMEYYHVLLDTTQIIKNHGFIGLVYSLRGDYLNAKENLLATVLLKRQQMTPNWAVLNLSNDEALSQKYYRESLIEAKKSATTLEETDPASFTLRNSYHDIGISYLKLNQPDSSLMYFKKAVKTAQSIKIDPFWNELSRAYSALGYYDSAIVCNKRAIKNSLDHGTRISLANGYEILGTTYMLNGDYENAINTYQKALKLHTVMEHKFARMTLLLNLSEVHFNYNQLDKSLIYTDSAISLAKHIGTRKGLSEGMLTKFSVLKAKGEFESALEVKTTYDLLTDSLQKGKLQLDLAKLDLYHDVEIGKLEIDDLNKQKALSEVTSKNQELIILIIVVVCIFVAALLILNYMKTRNLTKLNSKLTRQQSIITDQNIALTKKNEEKEILLKEIHHRVKNNLQTISSLLNIQQRKLIDPAAIDAIEDSKNRVRVMGLLHKFLYQHEDLEDISIKPYLEQLMKMIIASHKTGYKVSSQISICDVKTGVDLAINFGLIINEIVINSLKHAKPNGTVLKISLEVTLKEGQLKFILSDNGMLNQDISNEDSMGFGWKLVNSLVKKIEGQLEIHSKNGLTVTIIIPTPNAAAVIINE